MLFIFINTSDQHKVAYFYLTINPSAPKLNIGLYVKPGSTIIAPCYAGIIIIIIIIIIK